MRSNMNEVTKAAAAHLPVAQIEQLEDRKYQSGSKQIGINVNDSSTTAYNESLPVLKKLGVTSVRLWYGIDSWSDRKIEGGLQRAIDYSNQGYDVTMTIAIDDGKVPNPSDVKAWFAWAAGNDALRKAVDRWEIGNEVDTSAYFKGTLKQYVSNFLSPASQALHAEGEQVVSAGVSWNPEDVKEMIGYGMLDMVDAVGFHPYAKGVSQMKTNIASLQQIVAGRKPLVATEWNVRGFESNKTQWADALQDAYPIVRSGFDIDYYFCLFAINSPAGPAGLMYAKTNTINTAFYNDFLQASQGVSSTPVVGGTPSTGGSGSSSSGGTSTGNTPSQTDIKIALYNADTDTVISGYTDIKANQVIDLAKLPTRNLALVIVPTSSSAKSVKMKLNGKTVIQNSKPFAYFGDTYGNLHGQHFSAGSFSMVVTPYTKAGATGTAFASRTLNFSVKDTTKVTPPSTGTGDADHTAEVNSYSLINALTGQVIKGYSNITSNMTISLSSLPSTALALVANADEDAKSVKFNLNGYVHTETALPYAVLSDNNGKFNAWTPHVGKYVLSGTAYSGKNATGTKGSSLSVALNFVA